MRLALIGLAAALAGCQRSAPPVPDPPPRAEGVVEIPEDSPKRKQIRVHTVETAELPLATSSPLQAR